jgi:hypothetical protein
MDKETEQAIGGDCVRTEEEYYVFHKRKSQADEDEVDDGIAELMDLPSCEDGKDGHRVLGDLFNKTGSRIIYQFIDGAIPGNKIRGNFLKLLRVNRIFDLDHCRDYGCNTSPEKKLKKEEPGFSVGLNRHSHPHNNGQSKADLKKKDSNAQISVGEWDHILIVYYVVITLV